MCCIVTVVTLFLSTKERYAPVKPRDTSTNLRTFQPACPNPLSSTNSSWVLNSPSSSAPTHSHKHTSPSHHLLRVPLNKVTHRFPCYSVSILPLSQKHQLVIGAPLMTSNLFHFLFSCIHPVLIPSTVPRM